MIRPFDQLRKIARGKARYIDDGDPMKTSAVSGGLDPRNIRQLNEAIRCNSRAEAPSFRMAGFEISEFLATDSVHKKIVGFLIQSFDRAGKPATELLQLQYVHDGAPR